ncbi:DNA mismatch repair endonuclease MutL [Buchnera aphidicola]|uniref:DNA mismatch repair endonuclease MutL n=1 Tax=Buchnera aphidicola TaxID=9 RepID=UPI003463BBA9
MMIRMLPIEVISQISAGEIIHSPSSVVKELIENSIDAGATSIRVNIEKGGLQSIRISDNGFGMSKKDLKIAILRHTTSKIFFLNDLETIKSLGFRGEALSSITAISRTTLISCTKKNTTAWLLYTEGYNNPIILKPTSHPIGTSVTVCDLFYNVPVRQKFMKTEKSEFIKIHEVVRCMALSKKNIDITLKHNNKLIKHYVRVDNNSQNIIRLQSLFNHNFVKKLIPIDFKKDFMYASGWISLSEKKIFNQNKQYYYVNNRIVKNNIIRHAVHQAIQEIFGNNVFFPSILYIIIPNNKIDINIHPDKSEIEFNQSRLVHDFVYQAIIFSFKKNNKSTVLIKYDDVILKNSKLSDEKFFKISGKNKDKIPKKLLLKNFLNNDSNLQEKWKKYYFFEKTVLFNNFYKCFGYLLSLVNKYYMVIENNKGFFLISLPMAQRLVFISNTKNIYSNKIELFILPKAFKVKIIAIELHSIIKNKNILFKFGLYFFIFSHYLYLKTIPMVLKKQDWKKLFLYFLKHLFLKKSITYSSLLKWFALRIKISQIKWDNIKIIKVLSDMEKFCPIFIEFPPSELLQPINFNKKMSVLKI